VLQLLKLPDGTVKVLVEGAERAKILSYNDRPDYYEATVPKLSERGLIAIDNTLRDGTVADPEAVASDERAKLMARFNEHVLADSRTTSVMLTVRDGVTLVRVAARA